MKIKLLYDHTFLYFAPSNTGYSSSKCLSLYQAVRVYVTTWRTISKFSWVLVHTCSCRLLPTHPLNQGFFGSHSVFQGQYSLLLFFCLCFFWKVHGLWALNEALSYCLGRRDPGCCRLKNDPQRYPNPKSWNLWPLLYLKTGSLIRSLIWMIEIGASRGKAILPTPELHPSDTKLKL